MKTKTLSNSLTVMLKDGRQLGYAEYGDPAGKPILFFHGFPGSRLEPSHLQSIALSNNYRLIGLDRPGMGLSSIHQKHSILSWADDVEMFADQLDIKKFSIIGQSGGAPFVAACAYKIPHRINGAAIVSGIAPFEIPEATASLSRGDRFMNKIIQTMPWIVTGMMKITLMLYKKPWLFKQVLKQLPEVDRVAVYSIGSNETINAMLLEPFRNGVAGATQEFKLFINPWGFNIANIKCPTTIWHGGLDKRLPITHANLYAKLIPNAKLTLFKQEGHVSLLINHGEEILRSVCAK
jgi:pimeloyl-ACP methyl ester carboxylesterase